ncbi:MAG: hypothetical protein J6V72_11950 [Kiritimatiellae bacterium]|nr:hypothetical protein [Kiritimatiellia bacterium]
MKTTLHLLVLGTALSAAASGKGLTPYMTIVERMPFGRPSAEQGQVEAGAEASAAEGSGAQDLLDPEAERIAEHIRETVRVCAVNAPPGGEPVVGFTDTAQNPPKHYLLAQGQSKDGWTVLLVDAPKRHAVLSCDGISVSLYLGLPHRTEVGKGLSDRQADPPDVQVKPHRSPNTPNAKNAKRIKNAKRTKRANRSKRPKDAKYAKL